ncbi:MAG: helix-turn-helix domain-containing protein [Pseudomonadota bacterium]
MTKQTELSEVGRLLVQGAKEARAIARGEAEPAQVYYPPRDVDVAEIRKRQGLTQEQFSRRYALQLTAIREWERGRRQPDQAARAYLQVIACDPDAVVRALSLAREEQSAPEKVPSR